jgi:hypothetical protein
MDINDFFFRLYGIDRKGREHFLGSSFPVTPDGGLLTCAHVVAVDREELTLAVHDNLSGEKVFIEDVRLSERDLDMAFLPNALEGEERSFLPLLAPRALVTGESTFCYGFFAIGGVPTRREVEQGYFSGKIVNFTKTDGPDPIWSITLPFPVLEGMSGSPVLTYHQGPKVVGLAYGNRSTRIVASEVLEFEGEHEQFHETVHRVVEFGRGYHCAEAVRFLTEIGISSAVVTEDRVQMVGLE